MCGINHVGAEVKFGLSCVQFVYLRPCLATIGEGKFLHHNLERMKEFLAFCTSANHATIMKVMPIIFCFLLKFEGRAPFDFII